VYPATDLNIDIPGEFFPSLCYSRPMKQIKVNSKRRLIIIAAIVIGLAGLLFYFKNQFVIAWVNGRPITRFTYNQELQKLAKNQAIDSLLTKKLILAEAAKNKIAVKQEEIDSAIKDIDERTKAQGTNLDELLLAQGITRQALQEEIRLQKLLEKLVGEITLDEELITTYFNDNQTTLFKDKKLEEVKEEIKTQLSQQELINKIQELIARLQAEAKVVNWL